jgi:hypothetical protein
MARHATAALLDHTAQDFTHYEHAEASWINRPIPKHTRMGLQYYLKQRTTSPLICSFSPKGSCRTVRLPLVVYEQAIGNVELPLGPSG